MGSLEEVHMPQNGINYSGVMALASAMRHNPELRVLNLNDNTFTKRGTLAMAQVRPVHTVATSRVYKCSQCVWTVSVHGFQALRHLRNVQVINFGDCLVRSEGAIALAAVIREGLPILKVSPLSKPVLSACVRSVWSQCSAMFLVFRSSICHLVRSRRQQLWWWLRPSWTNLTWRKWIWTVRTLTMKLVSLSL